MKKNHYLEMDMLRGIAILGVVLIHISAVSLVSSQSTMEVFFIITNQVSRFAVPVFLFLSGLGLTLSHNTEEGYFSFLLRRLSKILPLYLFWTVVYLLITFKEQISVLDFVKSTLFGSAYYHLYYVPVIVMFYIMYPLFRTISNNNSAILLVLLLTISCQLSDELFGISVLKNSVNFLNWSIYFVLGIWFANSFEEKKQILREHPKLISLTLLVALIGINCETFLYLKLNLTIGDATTQLRPSIILYTVIFISFIFVLKWENKAVTYVIDYLSKYSYGIYLSHPFVLSTWGVLFVKIGLDEGTILFAVTSLPVVLSVSIIIARVIDLCFSKINIIPLKKVFKAKL